MEYDAGYQPDAAPSWCYYVTANDVAPKQGGRGGCYRKPKGKAGDPVQKIPDPDE